MVYPNVCRETLPYKEAEILLCEGEIKKLKKRYMIRRRGTNMFWPLHRIIWILTHPDEHLDPDDDVHHKNENRDDYHWENLERLIKEEHLALHRIRKSVKQPGMKKDKRKNHRNRFKNIYWRWLEKCQVT
jgi:hypothetical protein